MRTLRGAIVGYGFISAQGHMPAYLKRDDVDIVGICDVSEKVRRDLCRDARDVRIFSDVYDMLNQIVDLDFIDICTHAAGHFDIAFHALERGIHVLCEKPLATSTEEGMRLFRMAKSKNCVLYPCHNYKYAPVIKAINEILNSGEIGKIHTVTINTYRNTHAKGTEKWKPDWRRYKYLSGGGIAMDHGSHSLYLAFEWLNSYPLTVNAFAHNSRPELFDTEDLFNSVYRFPSGVAIFLTWTAGVRKSIYTLQGSKGAIRVEDDSLEIAKLRDRSDDSSISHKAAWKFENFTISSKWMDSGHSEWFNPMFDAFVKAVDKKQIDNEEIKQALWCLHCIESAYISVKNEGTCIPMKELCL